MPHFRRVHGIATAVLFVQVLFGLLWGQPKPASSDPVHLLDSTNQRSVELFGRVVKDLRPFDGGCSALLAVDRLEVGPVKGRT